MQSTLFGQLKIKGFRRLSNVDITFRPLTVMVGANGVGKTSMLDVMTLLAASADGKLNDAISELSGIGSIASYDGDKKIELALSMNVEGQSPIEYNISLASSGLAYEIQSEQLKQTRKQDRSPFMHIDSHFTDVKYFEVDQGKLLRPNWEHSLSESSLSQVPKMFKEPEFFRRSLASSTLYHVLNVAPRAPVRLPQLMRPSKLPGKDGEDLVSCLYYLRESDRDRFESIEDTLRAAFHDFERLDFPPVAAGTMTLAWKDRNYSRPIFAHQLSEGTLRFLWLITLLHSPSLPAITMIDEPEVSLHPEMLRLLAELFREASQRTQLMVATHSDRLVRFLDPSELAVMDMGENGMSSIRWADSLDIQTWMKDYSLDELWQMGRLGGRS